MNVLTLEKIEQISFENCKRLSHIALNYAQNIQKLTYCGAGVVVVSVVAYKLSFRKRFFAWLFNKASATKHEPHEAVKKAFLEPLSQQISHDPKLKEEKSIRILEVGVGAGTNFEHYPNGCRLVAVDPNPHFSQYYNNNRSKFPNIKSAEIILSTGEEMDMVASESVDAVVVTFVMCSVGDVAKFVCQIKRVLAPGGKFYFFEHVGEWNHKEHYLRRRIQQFLTYSGFWPFVFDGCHLTRDPLPTIRAVGGFANIQEEYFYAPLPDGIAKMLRPHVKGVVTK